MRCLGLILLALVACAPEESRETNPFNGIAPAGFGPITSVALPAGVYPVATQDDLVVEAANYDVRRVDADRIRIGFSGTVVVGLDGSETFQAAPNFYTTEPAIRVGGTDKKLIAVLVVSAFCGRPMPDAQTLYLWGDESVTRAEDTGEWQFTGLC